MMKIHSVWKAPLLETQRWMSFFPPNLPTNGAWKRLYPRTLDQGFATILSAQLLHTGEDSNAKYG